MAICCNKNIRRATRTALCTYTELEMQFPPMRIYIRHFILLIWGPRHKTLDISAWPHASAGQGYPGIFHRGVKFYFRAFVRPDYRFRPQCAGRGPRPVAELLGDSQIKSCLADKWNRIDFRYWETGISDRKSGAGTVLPFSFSSIAEYCTRPSPHAICNNNPRSVRPCVRPFPLLRGHFPRSLCYLYLLTLSLPPTSILCLP